MQDEQVWSTENIAASQRTAWWSDLMNRQFNGLETDFYGDRTCDGGLVTSYASDVVLARLKATRHRVVMAARPGCEAEKYLKIVAPYEGEVWVEQQNRVAYAKPGKWIAYDMAREYVVSNPYSVDHLVIVIPRSMLHGTEADLDDLVAKPMGINGFESVALQAMCSIYAELPLMNPRAREAAGETVAQLVRRECQNFCVRGTLNLH